jgi:hypothetical protein
MGLKAVANVGGGGGTVTGTGTPGTLAKFATASSVGDSAVLQAAGAIATVTLTNGGAAYTNGTYGQRALTGGAGTAATADFIVAGGIVTFCLLRAPGVGYLAGDVLSCATIGPGAGLVVTVATVVPAVSTVANVTANCLGAGTTNPRAVLGVVGGAMMDGATRTITFNSTTTNPVSNLNTLTIGSANAPAIVAISSVATDALHVNTLVDASVASAFTNVRGIACNPLISATTVATTGTLTAVNALAYRRELGDLATAFTVNGFQTLVGAGPGVGSNTTGTANAFTGTVQSGVAGHTITNGNFVNAFFGVTSATSAFTTLTAFNANAISGVGTIGTFYGFRLQASTTPTITNRYPIAQEDTLGTNFFRAKTAFGPAVGTAPGDALASVEITTNGTTNGNLRLNTANAVLDVSAASTNGVRFNNPGFSGITTTTVTSYVERASATCPFADVQLSTFEANGLAYADSGNAQITAATLVGSSTIGFVQIGKVVLVRGSYTITSVSYSAGSTFRVPCIDCSGISLPTAAIGLDRSDLLQIPAMLTNATDTGGLPSHIVEFRPGMRVGALGAPGRIVIGMTQAGGPTAYRTFGWNGTYSLPIGTVKFQFSYEAI